MLGSCWVQMVAKSIAKSLQGHLQVQSWQKLSKGSPPGPKTVKTYRNKNPLWDQVWASFGDFFWVCFWHCFLDGFWTTFGWILASFLHKFWSHFRYFCEDAANLEKCDLSQAKTYFFRFWASRFRWFFVFTLLLFSDLHLDYTFYWIFSTSFSNEKNGLKTKNNKKQSRCPNPKVRK